MESAVQDARLQEERQAQIREHSQFLQRQIEAKESRRRAEEVANREQAPPQSPVSTFCGDIAAQHKRNMLTSHVKEACAEQIAAFVAAPPSTCDGQGGSRAQCELREALDEQVRQ